MNQAVFPLYDCISNTSPSRFISLSDLVSLAASPTVGPKEKAAALTPYQATAKTKQAAQGAKYHALVIDHDHDNLSVDSLRQLYRDYQVPVSIYTTSSHTESEKRYKVVIPFVRPIPFDRFTEFATGAALLLGTDKAQSRVQQVFYAPNKLHPDADYFYCDDTAGRVFDPLDETHPFVLASLKANQDHIEAQQHDYSTSL